MTHELDYYAILQVNPNAEPEVVDAAYRKLAAKYHPDVSRRSDATARMQQINEAYRVLSDRERRADYDRRRRTGAESGGPRARIPDAGRQFARFLLWFFALFLLGETFQRLGGRGVLVLLVFGGVLLLLWWSRRVF
jgi:DnaJ-class molecular chaperone